MKYYLGKNQGRDCYVEWKLKDGKFSASGDVWNRMGTDIESGGQNLDELLELFPDDEQLFLIHRVWQRYHLNDMKAGSPIQTKLIEQEIRPAYEELDRQYVKIVTEYFEVKSRLVKAIDKGKWNQSYPTDVILKKIEDDVLDKMGNEKYTKTSTTYRFTDQKRGMVTTQWLSNSRSTIVTPIMKQWVHLYHTTQKPVSFYDFCCVELEKHGRLRDPDYIVDGEAYKYGTRWLKEELPEEVVEEINSWTARERTTLTPAEQFVQDNDCVVKYVKFEDKMNWYTLTVNDQTTFDFQAGTAHTNVDAVQIINCLLDEAFESSQGFDHCLDWCSDLGYSAKEAIKIARALVENWEKMEMVGLDSLLGVEDE